jgi:hypothetical protein
VPSLYINKKPPAVKLRVLPLLRVDIHIKPNMWKKAIGENLILPFKNSYFLLNRNC